MWDLIGTLVFFLVIWALYHFLFKDVIRRGNRSTYIPSDRAALDRKNIAKLEVNAPSGEFVSGGRF